MTDQEQITEPYKFTTRQRVFIEEYLRTFNATQSAIKAGYSKRTATQIGHENLTNIYIKAEIERRLTEMQMSADEVKTRLTDMARADIGQLADPNETEFVFDFAYAKKHNLTKLIKKIKTRKTIVTHKDGEIEEHIDTELELYDAQAALEKIGRHHKIFGENENGVKVEINNNVLRVVQHKDDDETKY